MKCLQRPVSLLVTLAMVLSLFCGMIPVAAAADDHESSSPDSFSVTVPDDGRIAENQPDSVPAAPATEESATAPAAIPGHTLTYDANGGYWGSNKDDKVRKQTDVPAGWNQIGYSEAGEEVGSPAPVHEPVRVGRTMVKVLFAGWSLDSRMMNAVMDKNGEPRGVITTSGLQVSRDITLYAVWAEDRNNNGKADYQEKSITVRFDAASGTSGEPKEFTLQPFPDKITVSYAPEVLPPAGQGFVKWIIQGNETQMLGNRAGFTYDSIFRMTEGKMTAVTFQAVYQPWETVTIRPADITVYMGGNGYQSVVGDPNTGEVAAGVSNGFPEPVFRVTLPQSLQEQHVAVTDLVLKYQDGTSMLTWTLEKYGPETSDLYRLVPGAGTDRRQIRMEFKKDGRTITEDRFDVRENLNQTLEMTVYGKGIQADKAFFAYGAQTFRVEAAVAAITVRGTTDGAQYRTVNGGTGQNPRVPDAAAAPDTTYTVNDGRMQVADTSGISLLFDNIIETNRVTNRTNSELLAAKADQFLGGGDSYRRYEFRYLDLVDRNNGNLWVKPNQNITVYWPLPAGTDKTTRFQVLQFRGVHRGITAEQVADAIPNSSVEGIAIRQVTDTHVVIDVGSNGFSPFALVWRNRVAANATTITYAPNGGSGKIRTQTYGRGNSVRVPDSFFTRPGYIFAGWNTAANGKGTAYSAGQKLVLTSSLRLYAQWREDGNDTTLKTEKYVLYYETNGGKKLEPESGKKVWIKEYKKLPVPARTGYSFEGWYSDKGLTKAATGNVTVDGVVTLYAKWREDKPVEVTDHTGVSRWLNTKERMAYLQGLPNNRFGPGQNITRAEVAQMFYNLLLNRNVPTTVAFTDVPADAWYANAVNALASMGVIKGVGGSGFAPSRSITRAEFTAIALRFGRLDASATNSFSDVSTGDWFCQEVSGAVRYGWIKGFTDGTFRPYLPITRAEVAVIANRMLGRSAGGKEGELNNGQLRRFTDVDTGNWAYYDILEATNSRS